MVYKGRKQGTSIKGKCNSLIYSTLHVLDVYAKYRTITFSFLIIPLFPSFLRHYCLLILYATNQHIENVFITCSMLREVRGR